MENTDGIFKHVPAEDSKDNIFLFAVLNYYRKNSFINKELSLMLSNWIDSNKQLLGIPNIPIKSYGLKNYKSLEIFVKEFNRGNCKLDKRTKYNVNLTLDLIFDYNMFPEKIHKENSHPIPWISMFFGETKITLIGGIDEFSHYYDDNCQPWFNVHFIPGMIVDLAEKINRTYADIKIKKLVYKKKNNIDVIYNTKVNNPYVFRLAVDPYHQLKHVLQFMKNSIPFSDSEPYKEYSSEAFKGD